MKPSSQSYKINKKVVIRSANRLNKFIYIWYESSKKEFEIALHEYKPVHIERPNLL